jgi:4-amino-4-deoxy-L-arabinose transferase-like glycosyltransferase
VTDQRLFWTITVALLLLTRVPVSAEYLSIDNVNLAFSLENFDPNVHQPQPPGYPLFVALGRLVNFFFRDAEDAFHFISLVTSALCLPLAFGLGRRMFSPWVGQAAVLLLLVNPVFWFSALDGPLRPFLALFSLLTAYCSWRCWNGERDFLVWGAAALAVGSGFRPDLMAFLFPVWIVSAWLGTRSASAVLKGLAVMSAIVLAWVAALAFAVGGFSQFYALMLGYTIEQTSGESVLLGAAQQGWLRQLSRLVIWNGLAVIGWVWATPFFARSGDRVHGLSREGLFMMVWLVPGLTVQALVHVAAPGHTLFSIPALCLAGAYVLHAALGSLERRYIGLSAALMVSLMLFLNFFKLPDTSTQERGLQRIRNVLLFATFETSLSGMRWLDQTTELGLREVWSLAAADRPTVIVTTDIHYQQWYTNWRIARYYLPETEMWVVADQKVPREAQRIRRDQYLETRRAPVVPVPVPKGGRVLWLLEENGPFHRALASVKPLNGATQVFYTDIANDDTAFRVLDFEFVPTDSAAPKVSGVSP